MPLPRCTTIVFENAGFVPDAVTLATGGTVRWATGPAERVRHGLVLAAGGVAVDAVMVEPGAVVPSYFNLPGDYIVYSEVFPFACARVRVVDAPPARPPPPPPPAFCGRAALAPLSPNRQPVVVAVAPPPPVVVTDCDAAWPAMDKGKGEQEDTPPPPKPPPPPPSRRAGKRGGAAPAKPAAPSSPPSSQQRTWAAVALAPPPPPKPATPLPAKPATPLAAAANPDTKPTSKRGKRGKPGAGGEGTRGRLPAARRRGGGKHRRRRKRGGENDKPEVAIVPFDVMLAQALGYESVADAAAAVLGRQGEGGVEA